MIIFNRKLNRKIESLEIKIKTITEEIKQLKCDHEYKDWEFRRHLQFRPGPNYYYLKCSACDHVLENSLTEAEKQDFLIEKLEGEIYEKEQMVTKIRNK